VLEKVLREVCRNLSPQMKWQIDEDLLLIDLLMPHMYICKHKAGHPRSSTSSGLQTVWQAL